MTNDDNPGSIEARSPISERLRDWGWTPEREDELRDHVEGGKVPARVIAQHRGEYRLMTPWAPATGVAPGRMLHRASGHRELPAVGDWVLIEPSADGPATVVEILPRRTQFVRRRAGGEGGEQVIAANVDVACIVSSLNQELNQRRIERYLVAAWESGAMPLVVLTKSDLCADIEALVDPVRDVAAGVPVAVVSSVTGAGLEELRRWIQPRRTAVLIGSSGVGKSTLVNTLAGTDLLDTQDVRAADDKGRHTTTHREIFRLAGGELLLDTPGMRELGLVEAEEGLDETFDDVAELTRDCRFRDCGHAAEPGCAVRAAVDSGAVAGATVDRYLAFRLEAEQEERRIGARERPGNAGDPGSERRSSVPAGRRKKRR
jgi:ribosome biogenesis GTPase